MNIPVLTFFNNKGGVGKTTLVYHLAWMFAELGKRVIAVDLDPQANLTAAFLDEDEIEKLWSDRSAVSTIAQAVEPLEEVRDLTIPEPIQISQNLFLVAGDIALSRFEDVLAGVWPDCLGDAQYRPFRITTAFWQIAQKVAINHQADLILFDVGPNLGAINRSALIGADFVVVPLGADLFSLQGLKNLGPTLRSWRKNWDKRIDNWEKPKFDLPDGSMLPLGYVVQQLGLKLSRPVKAYDRWANRIPAVYRSSIIGEPSDDSIPASDPNCLATLKHFRSLIPMAQEARKPLFDLTPADGAIGAHATAVQDGYKDFRLLARTIISRMEQASM